MNKKNHLDTNLEALLTSTEPQLRLPADRKAEILARLLAPPASSAGGHMRKLKWFGSAAAALLALVIGGLYLIQGSNSVAFAEVLESLQKRGYTFTTWSRQDDGELQKTGRGMVLQPGLVRWDMPAGQFQDLALVVDSASHTVRWVTKTGKDLGTVEMPAEMQGPSDQFLLFRPVEKLWGIVDGTEESLGAATKEGVEVTGYRVEEPFEIAGQKGSFIYTIWANTATGLPHEVGIATVDPNGTADIMVLREFDFEAAIDETLFGLGPEPAVEDVNDSLFVVRPNVGMGDLLLGGPDSMIVEVLGEPEFKMGDQIYQYAGFVVAAREGKVYSFQCGDAKGPGSRHWKECRCRTVEGIGIGSSEQDILKTYGAPAMRPPEPDKLVMVYRQQNMAFFLRNDEVYFMSFGIARDTKARKEP
jgi:hypothetical protein